MLVLDMGEPIKIVDIARRLVEESAQRSADQVHGPAPGEKLHEVLLSSLEQAMTTEHPLITRVARTAACTR